MSKLMEMPKFDGDLVINIKSLGEITSNMSNARDYALSMKEYYSNVIFTEDTMAVAKDEKAKINKLKSELASKRKDTIAEFNKPIKEFEALAKETESILNDTYNVINAQVVTYEEKLKEEKKRAVDEFFQEYKKLQSVEFLKLEQVGLNITLNASLKSLKEKCKKFVDKIKDDIDLINSEDFKDEIMYEYKQNLNITKAIYTVKNRKAQIEREKEITDNHKAQAEDLENKLENLKSATVEPPAKEKLETAEEILDYSFRAVGTKSKVKEVLRYAQKLGIKLYKI